MDTSGWNFEVSEVKPNYSYMFDFEVHFTHQKTRIWMQENWTYVFWWVVNQRSWRGRTKIVHQLIRYSGVYMLVIFGGQQFMANRPRYVARNHFSVYLCLVIRIEASTSSRENVQWMRAKEKEKKIDNLVSYPEPNVKQHQARLKLRNFVQNKTVEWMKKKLFFGDDEEVLIIAGVDRSIVRSENLCLCVRD